jgi:ATP-dependent DNA helicase PIF1
MGPSLGNEGGHSLVPIFRSRRDFYRGAASCFRTQFPITNAYAITVHKAQGMSVKKAVLNLTARDFVAGLSYVAVSRVKSLRGILFEEPFDFERFRVRISDTVKSRLADRERRLPEHVGFAELEELDIPLRSTPTCLDLVHVLQEGSSQSHSLRTLEESTLD